jgi:LUD domain
MRKESGMKRAGEDVADQDAAGSGTPDRVEAVAAALRSHKIDAVVVSTAEEAREAVLAMIPEGAEVHTGKSKTLEDVGLFSEIVESGRYDAIRARMFTMDRATQGREIRKLVAAPDYMLGSVAALTEDGTLVAASATGSQLTAYSSGAGRLVLVVGSQKIVPDLDAALRRIREVAFPYENAQVRARLGVDTALEKVLLIHGEWQAGRTTVVLVREPVGV